MSEQRRKLPKTIFRVVKNRENPYVMMDKRPLENHDLSWGAKGLLSYMLSRPDDWQFNIEDLIHRSKDGEYALRALIRELRCAGHVQFKGRENMGGLQGTKAIWSVFEVPVSRPRSDNRDEQLPVDLVGHVVVTSSRKSRPTNNKDSTNKEEEEGSAKIEISLGEAYTAYGQEIGVITPHIADEIDEACQVHGTGWVVSAMKIASANGKRNWAYVKAILGRWRAEGYGSDNAPRGNGRRGNSKPTISPRMPDADELHTLRELAKKELG